MKLAFHSATTMTCDLETDISITAKAGFKALEVWAKKVDHYLETHTPGELKAAFEHNKVEPLAINSIEFIAFRGSEYPRIQARLNELGSIAQAIGCPVVILVPSPTPDRNLGWEEIMGEYVEVLQDLSGIARQYQVRLAFEFLGFGWSSVRTPRAASDIVCRVDRENVGLTIDAAHFYGGGGLLSELDLLDPGKIFAFHLNDVEDTPKEAIRDSTRLLPGLGVVPLDAICARLKSIGYTGPCAVELFRPEYWERDPSQVAQETREAALKILSPHFRIE